MKKIFILFIVFLVVSCSTSEKSTNKTSSTNEKTYVFDEIKTVPDTASVKESKITNIPDTSKVQNEKQEVAEKEKSITEETNEQPLYFVQIGAFKTQEAAEQFVKEAKELLKDQELTITFSDDKELFVVQLPPFKDRKQAEKVRNRLWRYDKFKDAFIVTQQ